MNYGLNYHSIGKEVSDEYSFWKQLNYLNGLSD